MGFTPDLRDNFLCGILQVFWQMYQDTDDPGSTKDYPAEGTCLKSNAATWKTPGGLIANI